MRLNICESASTRMAAIRNSIHPQRQISSTMTGQGLHMFRRTNDIGWSARSKGRKRKAVQCARLILSALMLDVIVGGAVMKMIILWEER